MQTKQNLSIKKIVTIAFALCILICAKYKFGMNIDGIEIVTSLFILFALIFNFINMIILVISFNILVLIIYGFGYWWIAYWYIWPIMIILFNLFYKFIARNNITFAMFCGLMGILMMGFYFINDLCFMGFPFACSQLLSALPINAIEGVINCTFGAIAYYPFLKLIDKINICNNIKIYNYCINKSLANPNILNSKIDK